MTIEQWKPWPGYENIAEVSSMGNARTKDRVITQKSSLGKEYTKTNRGAKLALTDNGTGYKQVKIVVDGKTIRWYIHRLVAYLFVEGYAEGLEVDHKDENKSNNVYTNLVWVTRKSNMEKCLSSNPHIIKNLKNQ
jgi:hypothetical protein